MLIHSSKIREKGSDTLIIYVVKAGNKVSQEGYRSLKEAQSFIESRTGEKREINPYTWEVAGTKYEITEVGVR